MKSLFTISFICHPVQSGPSNSGPAFSVTLQTRANCLYSEHASCTLIERFVSPAQPCWTACILSRSIDRGGA